MRKTGDLTAGIHGDLLGQVALRHRGGHLGDVADLIGQVSRHRVHRLGEIPPYPGHALDPRLPAEIALGADLAGDPGDLVGKGRELVHHGVHRRTDAQELAPHRLAGDLHRNMLRKIALRDRGDDPRDLVRRPRKVVDERVDRLVRHRPTAFEPEIGHPLGQPAVPPDHLAHPLQFEGVSLLDAGKLVETRCQQCAAAAAFPQPNREVTVTQRGEGTEQIADELVVHGRGFRHHRHDEALQTRVRGNHSRLADRAERVGNRS